MRFVFSDSSNVVRIVLIAILSIAVIPVPAALKEVADEDVKFQSAETFVLSQLKREGLRMGLDAANGRCVIVEKLSVEMDPARDPDFVERRNRLESHLFMMCQCGLARVMATRISATETVTEREESVKQIRRGATKGSEQSRAVSSVMSQPIDGMQILHLAESFDGKRYEIAMAAIWSRKLQNQTRGILEGKDVKGSPTNIRFAEWVDRIDLSTPVSPRFVYDDDGLLHVIGIGISALNGDQKHDCVAREAARAHSRAAVVRSLHVQCEGRTECSEVLNDDRIRMNISSHEAVRIDSCVSGLREVKCGETSLVFGPRVFVSVSEINSRSVAQESDLEQGRYSAAIRASGDLSSSIVAPCARGLFVGECAFPNRSENGDFPEQWKKAFEYAFTQAVSHALEGGKCQQKGCQQSKCDSEEGDGAPSGHSVTSDMRRCEMKLTESDFGWEEQLSAVNSSKLNGQVELSYADEQNFRQDSPLIGDFSISQQDEYDPRRGTYMVRVRIAGGKSKLGKLSIDECIAKTDFKKMIGPRRYRDKNGDVWLFGIGVADAESLEQAKAKSAEDAKRFLAMAAGVEFSSQTSVQGKLEMADGVAGAVSGSIGITRSVSSLKGVRQKISFFKKRKFVGVDEHPLTGKKIYTTVYVVNAKGSMK